MTFTMGKKLSLIFFLVPLSVMLSFHYLTKDILLRDKLTSTLSSKIKEIELKSAILSSKLNTIETSAGTIASSRQANLYQLSTFSFDETERKFNNYNTQVFTDLEKGACDDLNTVIPGTIGDLKKNKLRILQIRNGCLFIGRRLSSGSNDYLYYSLPVDSTESVLPSFNETQYLYAKGSPPVSISLSASNANSVKLTSELERRLRTIQVGSTAFRMEHNGKDLLIAKAEVFPSFSLVSVSSYDEALTPFYLLTIKSLLFGVGLMCFAQIANLIMSRHFSERNGSILHMISNLSEGNFDIEDKLKGSDEMKGISTRLASLATKIKTLMEEGREKMRLTTEVSLAAEIQNSFLPEPSFSRSGLEVRGFIEQAESCGGDWWYFLETDNNYYALVADVTGHGLKSALLTSAARATLSQISTDVETKIVMDAFNKSIFDIAKGALQMTSFVLKISKDLRTMEYSNASHEPPFFFVEDEFKPLDDVHGPRLGQTREAHFGSTSFLLGGKWDLLMFTDGLPDLVSKDNKKFGERRILKSLSSAKNERDDTTSIFSGFLRDVEKFRNNAPLVDDLTFVYISSNKDQKVA